LLFYLCGNTESQACADCCRQQRSCHFHIYFFVAWLPGGGRLKICLANHYTFVMIR
jgi:hypothetical protein